ncbi:MAG: type VII secretion-associated protein [Corynebacterium sp.]|nr:type VII secretion-associated protein [Corynebacterium sp.]
MSRIRLEINLLETATIISGVPGADAIYRYDLPAAGVAEGWAAKAVCTQIKEIGGPDWPDIDVAVKGDKKATESLISALLAQGVLAFPAEYSPEKPAKKRRKPLLTCASLASVFVVLAAIGAMVYARDDAATEVSAEVMPANAEGQGSIIYNGKKINLPTSSPVMLPGTQSGTQSGNQSGAQSMLGGSQEPTSSSSAASLFGASDGNVQLNGFVVPSSVNWQVVGDGVVGSLSTDPDQRIMVLRDLVYEDELMLEMITEDPNLRAIAPRHGRANTIDYVEEPGDGSVVYWTSWRENPTRISIGCHTRQQPTEAQMSRCNSLVEQTNTLKKTAGS